MKCQEEKDLRNGKSTEKKKGTRADVIQQAKRLVQTIT